MTSFLANLVERSLSSAPAVQPRLPSLFEPPMQSAAEVPGSRAEPSNVIEAPKPAASNQEATPNSRQKPEMPLALSERETPKAPTLVAPTIPVVVLTEKPESADRLSGVQSKATSVVVALSTATTRETKSPSTALGTSEVSKAEAVPPPPTLLVPMPAPDAASVITAAPTSGVPEPARPSPAQPAPGPIIQVRIGRIDLRAVAAADPSKPPPARPKPGLSLEDYLKSRKEAKR